MNATIQPEWVDWQQVKVLQKAAVVDEVGNVLSLKRATGGPAGRHGKWDLPGGSVGPEDVVVGTKPHAEAVMREIREETGLDVIEIQPVFVDSWVFERSVGKVLGIAIGYRVTVAGTKPTPVLSHEHTDHLWDTKENVLHLDFGSDNGFHKTILENIIP